MLKLSNKKLKAWKKSILSVKEIYKLTQTFPDTEKFGLSSQMRRAAVSISSNISEGASRKSQIERNRFYEIARSSLVELDAQIEISIELGYLNPENLAELAELLNANFALITSMIKKLKYYSVGFPCLTFAVSRFMFVNQHPDTDQSSGSSRQNYV